MTMTDARELGRFHVPAFTLADRLVKARTDAGITQERMGELLGCSRRTIVRYETSAHVPRSVVLAYRFATQTDLEWLETGNVPAWCTPRDLNPEPTVIGAGALAEVISIDEARTTRVRVAMGGEAA